MSVFRALGLRNIFKPCERNMQCTQAKSNQARLGQMPRPSVVESHGCRYCSHQRETPRDKLVASERRQQSLVAASVKLHETSSLVSTQLFVPEAQSEISRWWRLCGTTGNKAERPSSPERAREARAGLTPFQGWEPNFTPSRWLRCAPPPANLRRPSGTKTHLSICVDTNETSSWHLLRR